MSKKYEFTDETITVNGITLHRIKALIDFDRFGIKAGDLGGFIEVEANLSHNGNAWVYGDALVYGNALVSENAKVFPDALVYGNANVSGNARVSGNALVSGNARVSGNAKVSGNAWVSENAKISGDAWVYGNAKVSGNAKIKRSNDYACVNGFGPVYKNTTFFRCEDDLIRAQCGWFYGTIDEFRAKVKETHGDSKYAKEYLMIADLMEYHFSED